MTLTLISNQTLASTDSQILSQQPYWHILVHADHNKPTIPDARFYLASQKDWSPEKELQATLAAFREGNSLNDAHAICRYPARFQWLLTQLKLTITDFPQPTCVALDDYYRQTDVQKVTINFASEDINSVTTMFGHVYFDLIGSRETSVSHSISYVTPIAGKSAPKLLYESFLGGDGFLVLESSRKTLQNYLYTQQRNVWQYPIDLSPLAIRRLVNHAWELKGINAGYRFIDHNCGTLFFNLLATAKPEIIHYAKKPWTTPLEYLQLLNEHQLLNTQRAQFHLAPKYAMRALYETLPKGSLIQSDTIYHTLSDSTIQLNLPVSQQAPAIYLAEQRLLNDAINGDITPIVFNQKQRRLTQLNQSLPVDHQLYLDFSKYKNPLKATKGSRIQLATQQTDWKHKGSKTEQLIGFLPENSLLTDNHHEYFGDYELVLGQVVFSYEADNDRLNLYELNLYGFQSLLPSYVLDQQALLSANIGAKPFYDANLTSHLGATIQAGIGYATHVFSPDVVAFGFGHLGYYYADSMPNQHQPYAQPQMGFSVNQVLNMKLFFNARYTMTQSEALRYWHTELSQIFYVSPQHSLLLKQEYLQNSNDSANRLQAEWRYHF